MLEERLVEYLRGRIVLEPNPFPDYAGVRLRCGGREVGCATPEEVAEALLADAEFAAFRLGGLLGSPDGQLLSRAVRLVIPAPYRMAYSIVNEGLVLAARLQQEGRRERAREVLGVTLGVCAVVGGVALAKKR